MEENSGLAVEMSKRLLKKPDATVDAVLKVNRSILLLKRSYLQKFSLCFSSSWLLRFLSTSLMNSRMNRYTLLKIQQCGNSRPPESSSEPKKNAITKCHVITKCDDKSKVLM